MCKRLMCTLLAMAVLLSLTGAVPFEVDAESETSVPAETETESSAATESETETTDSTETELITEPSEDTAPSTEPVTEPSEETTPVTDPTEETQPEEEQGMKLSLEGEKLLKKYEGFSKYPYWDYSQWSVGYGTSYDMANHERYMTEGISVEEADGLLWGHIHSKSAHILKMAENAGITLTQNQYDALVLFTYNVGIGWMYSADSEILEAVINGASDNEFIYAIVLWCKADRVTSDGLINRRLAEANMYLNGVYSRSVPDDYNFVRFEANGGTLDYTVQGYDVDQPVEIYVNIEPTYQDSDGNVYNFLGWFTEPNGGTQVTVLDSSLGYGVHLYAHWDYSHNEPVPDDSENVVPADGIWGTVMDIGSLNIRSGAGTSYPILGTYRGGARVLILEQKKVGSTYWGRTDKGWISLDYVVLDEVQEKPTEPTTPPETDPPETEPPQTNPPETIPPETNPPETTPPETTPPETTPPETDPPETDPPVTEPPADVQTGTIVVDPRLRIRDGAGTGYKVVGYYYNGDRVAILETTSVDGVLWGRTDKGWISMEYVVLDSDNGGTEPTTPPETTPPETTPPETTPPETVPPETVPPVTQAPETQPPETIPPETVPPTTEPSETEPSEPVPPETEPSTEPDTTGPWSGEVVTSNRLRIRSGAGNAFGIVGYLFDGAAVTVTEKVTVGSQVWGKIAQGWICLDDVYLDGDDDFFASSEMTVSSSSLRLREAAGLGNSVIGYLCYGDKVQILEQIIVDHNTWVCTQYGWVNLKYLN